MNNKSTNANPLYLSRWSSTIQNNPSFPGFRPEMHGWYQTSSPVDLLLSSSCRTGEQHDLPILIILLTRSKLPSPATRGDHCSPIYLLNFTLRHRRCQLTFSWYLCRRMDAKIHHRRATQSHLLFHCPPLHQSQPKWFIMHFGPKNCKISTHQLYSMQTALCNCPKLDPKPDVLQVSLSQKCVRWCAWYLAKSCAHETRTTPATWPDLLRLSDCQLTYRQRHRNTQPLAVPKRPSFVAPFWMWPSLRRRPYWSWALIFTRYVKTTHEVFCYHGCGWPSIRKDPTLDDFPGYQWICQYSA